MHGDIELWKKLKYFSIFIVMTAIKQQQTHTRHTEENEYHHRTSQNVRRRF